MRILVNRIIGINAEGQELHYIEASGDSTEAKPTEESIDGVIVDSSNVFESDTADMYFWNEKSSTWIKA